ncbi:MAG TPA: FHA domain-containing protein [Gemmatimonadaceae bacterium]
MTSSTADRELRNGRLTALSDGRVYSIPAAGLLIGRHPSCDIVLASLRASRRHARVVPAPDGYALVDDSTNGVVVNGVRVDGRIVLKQGDIIGIGETAFRFSTDAASDGPDRSIFAGTQVPRATAPEPVSPTVPTETTPRAKRPDEKSKKE